MSKPIRRTTDPAILRNPRARYMLLVEGVMTDVVPHFQRFSPPITYHTYFGDFAGTPGIEVWFGFSSRAEHERARATGLTEDIRRIATSELLARGYPPSAVASELLIDFTSEEEIEARGGEFAYFR